MLEEPYCLFPNPDVYFENKPTIQKKSTHTLKVKRLKFDGSGQWTGKKTKYLKKQQSSLVQSKENLHLPLIVWSK